MKRLNCRNYYVQRIACEKVLNPLSKYDQLETNQTDKVVLDRILAGQQSNIMNMMMTEMNHAVAILAFAMNFQRNPVKRIKASMTKPNS